MNSIGFRSLAATRRAAVVMLTCGILLTLAAKASGASMTILGDSLSDGNGAAYGSFPNWHTQIAPGRFSAVHNYAVGGSVASNVLLSQLPAALNQAVADDYTILMIGGNDAVAAFLDHNLAALATSVAQIISTVDQLRAAGAQPVLANIPDVLATPVSMGMGTNAQRLAFRAALDAANLSLHTQLMDRGVPYFDFSSFLRELGSHGATLQLGETLISYGARYGADLFHPSGVLHGLIGNAFLEVINSAHGENFALMSDQTILVNTNRPATGATSYLDLTPYVVVPVPEPPTISLSALAILSLSVLGRRQLASNIRFLGTR